jgi:hypothetical protein
MDLVDNPPRTPHITDVAVTSIGPPDDVNQRTSSGGDRRDRPMSELDTSPAKRRRTTPNTATEQASQTPHEVIPVEDDSEEEEEEIDKFGVQVGGAIDTNNVETEL